MNGTLFQSRALDPVGYLARLDRGAAQMFYMGSVRSTDMYLDAIERRFTALTDGMYEFIERRLMAQPVEPSVLDTSITDGVPLDDPALVDAISKRYTGMAFEDF